MPVQLYSLHAAATSGYCLLLALLLCVAEADAQLDKQTDTSAHFVPIIPLDKSARLSNVDVIFNMQAALDNGFADGQYGGGKFNMNQFRLEIRGRVAPHVYFRFRDRYTRAAEPQTVDGVSRSTDMAFIDLELSKKWGLALGKLCADFGGYEFDTNPIFMYDYNDIVKYGDNFLSGVQASWKMNERHRFTVQVLNARTRAFREVYDTLPPNIQPAQFPSLLVGNWRGKLFHGKVGTLWSYGLFTQAQHSYVYYLALGNRFDAGKWHLKYDFKWAREDLDRNTVITRLIPKSYYPYPANDVAYIEHWIQAEYRASYHWNAGLVAFTGNDYWKGNPAASADPHLRTTWGIIPSIEYLPFTKLNMRFFCSYTARIYHFTPYAQTAFGLRNSHTGLAMIGVLAPLAVL